MEEESYRMCISETEDKSAVFSWSQLPSNRSSASQGLKKKATGFVSQGRKAKTPIKTVKYISGTGDESAVASLFRARPGYRMCISGTKHDSAVVYWFLTPSSTLSVSQGRKKKPHDVNVRDGRQKHRGLLVP